MEKLELKLDEANGLIFEVNITGADSEEAEPKYRFFCGTNSMELVVEGRSVDGKVYVDIPVLKGVLNEGVYPARLEVLVEDRYFTPLEMNVEFKKSLMVTAESVTVNKKKSSKAKRLNEENSAPEITASASVVAVKNSSKLTTLKEKFSKKH